MGCPGNRAEELLGTGHSEGASKQGNQRAFPAETELEERRTIIQVGGDEKMRNPEIRGILSGRNTPKVCHSASQALIPELKPLSDSVSKSGSVEEDRPEKW